MLISIPQYLIWFYLTNKKRNTEQDINIMITTNEILEVYMSIIGDYNVIHEFTINCTRTNNVNILF